MQHFAKNQAGLSLLECLFALSIAAILTLMAVPSFATTLQKTTVESARDEWFAAILSARTMAVETKQNVVVCAATDSRRCNRTQNFSAPLLAFVDNNENWRADPGERIIANAMSGQVRIQSTRNGVLYHPTGNSAGSNQTLRFCLPGLSQGAAIVIANSGRARTQQATCT